MRALKGGLAPLLEALFVGLRWLSVLMVWSIRLGWLLGWPPASPAGLPGPRTGEVSSSSDVARTFGLLWLRRWRGSELELELWLRLGLG